MNRINLDREWMFSTERPSLGRPASGGAPVSLPHDFTIHTDVTRDAPSGHATGYYGGGIGTYTKMLDVPADWADKRILLECDGAYMNAVVEVNAHAAGLHHYGYTPFHTDLTPYLKSGKQNRITIIVNNSAQFNSRWYSGSGLYRHVDLRVAGKVHISPWGIFARTERIEDNMAVILLDVQVENHTDRSVTRRVRALLSHDDAPLAGADTQISIPANGTACARMRVTVQNPPIWDIDTPNLCRVSAEILDHDQQEDFDCTEFGIRTVSVDARRGFQLNGRTIKLKGGCIHHDNGILGAASFYESEYRKLKIHKDNGYNAVRCAHNPPSRDMLTAADALGMLVIDEAFDCWRMGKNLNDYNLYFESDWKQDLTAFMRRDRNHPSVVIWSTGNEIVERAGLSNGYAWAETLASAVRETDPSRPVTNALCSLWSGLEDEDAADLTSGAQNEWNDSINRLWTRITEPFAAPLDIVGYNYLDERYEKDGEIFPNRVICGTESFPMQIDKIWREVKRLPYVIGDFTWTSYDYIGEAAIGRARYMSPTETSSESYGWNLGSEYPWRLANDADFDILGFVRPQGAYRRVVWGSQETYIACHSPENYEKTERVSRWGWPWREHTWTWSGWEEKPVRVDIYSAAQEVELILNGVSLGKKPAGEENRFTATFETVYRPGVLEAVSYQDGKVVSRDRLQTAGEPVRLIAHVENDRLSADGKGLSFITYELQDAEGNRVPHEDVKVRVTVTGAGSLAAFGSARPVTEENYTGGEFTTYDGRVQAIVRSGYDVGEVRVVASAEGFQDVITVLRAD